jgi:predicted GH43/DUF377 family glycosyl hydrolase
MAPAWWKTCLLLPADLPASRPDFEVLGTFNPAAVAHNDSAVLLVRVAERPLGGTSDRVALPHYVDGELTVDWFAANALEQTDRRVARVISTGTARLTSVSHLRVVHVRRDHTIERIGTAIMPQGECEEFGIEDPRITHIGSRYYVTYVAVSRHGAATALMSTSDFETFERHGVIFPTENKDVVLLPEPISGLFVAIHRPVCSIPFTEPEMWIAQSPDLVHWGNHRPLYRGQAAWETGRVGAGAPPVRTPRGWLELYHGNRRPTTPGDIGAYCAGAFILDHDDPARILHVASRPVLEPTEPFECDGFVPNVVFPGGVVTWDDRVAVYYGAADQSTAVAEIPWDGLWTAIDS